MGYAWHNAKFGTECICGLKGFFLLRHPSVIRLFNYLLGHAAGRYIWCISSIVEIVYIIKSFLKRNEAGVALRF